MRLIGRLIGTMITLFALWLLMSGLFKPLLIGLGIGSVLTVVYVTWRMDQEDGDHATLELSPIRFLRYFFWLMGEIARANWTVTKIILSRDMPTRQHLFKVPASQKGDLAKVVYATSITLTPGTITVETEGDSFFVHALCFADTTKDELADMDARVAATEPRGMA